MNTDKRRTIITEQGKSLLAQALASNQELKLKYMYLSDSKIANSSMINMSNIKHIQEINNIYVDSTNKNKIVVETIVGADIGGFFINSVGLYTEDKKLFAIAEYPSTYKENDIAMAHELLIEFTFALSEAEQVAITFNKDYILATKSYVDNELISLQAQIIKNTNLISKLYEKEKK